MIETQVKQKRYSIEEYFAHEEKAEEKHEFHNGKIINMPGGSIPHNKIAVNISAALNDWFKQKSLPFFVLNSDTKIRIEKFNRYVYPDTLVVCEKIQYSKGCTDTILNPTLVFEVSSDSTEKYDRQGKFSLYRSLPSFKEYVLVNQYKSWVDAYFLKNGKEGLWKISTETDIEKSIHLHSINFDLPLSDIYWQVPELQGRIGKIDLIPLSPYLCTNHFNMNHFTNIIISIIIIGPLCSL